MSAPLFSIVVPTRGRFETVVQTIGSILSQDYPDYELIISDNSRPEDERLARWVQSHLPGRENVRYFRTDGSLEMDVNWEQASARAIGRYLMIVPDRWLVRGGTLRLLSRLVEDRDPACAFWDTKLAIDPEGRFRRPVDVDGPVECEVRSAPELLDRLLQFTGYEDKTVFTQPFPRGLNSICRVDLAQDIRRKTGRFFAPNACDYTSGLSLLLNTNRIVHLRDSLYVPVGNDSNGARLATFGVPERLKHATTWRGLSLDCVFLTVMNDIEETLRVNGQPQWSERINHPNVLFSVLTEIHTKEWLGSPLATARMKRELMEFAERNRNILGGDIAPRLRAFDEKRRPNLQGSRRLLRRLGLFQPLYRFKHAVSRGAWPTTGQSYINDYFGDRQLLIREGTAVRDLHAA